MSEKIETTNLGDDHKTIIDLDTGEITHEPLDGSMAPAEESYCFDKKGMERCIAAILDYERNNKLKENENDRI